MKVTRPRLDALQILAPVRSLRPCPQCSLRLSQRRDLSSTSSRRAVMGQIQMPRNVAGQAPSGARQSQQMLLKGIKSSRIPTDLGQLPLTFVSPPLRELYQMYRDDKRKLLSVLWLRIKRSVQTPLQLLYQLKWSKRKNHLTGKYEKTPPLELTNRLEVARSLHARLMKAIADQDEGTVKEIACSGLSADTRSKIAMAKGRKLPKPVWSIKKYNGLRPPKWIIWPFSSLIPFRAIKVMSDHAVAVPLGGKETTWRQIVVRIKSRQSIDRGDGKGVQSKDMTEHVLIQNITGEGMNKGWMIWGTGDASNEETIDNILVQTKMNKAGGWLDRIRNMMPGGTPSM